MQAKHPCALNKNKMENRKKENVDLVYKFTEKARVRMPANWHFVGVNDKKKATSGTHEAKL